MAQNKPTEAMALIEMGSYGFMLPLSKAVQAFELLAQGILVERNWAGSGTSYKRSTTLSLVTILLSPAQVAGVYLED